MSNNFYHNNAAADRPVLTLTVLQKTATTLTYKLAKGGPMEFTFVAKSQECARVIEAMDVGRHYAVAQRLNAQNKTEWYACAKFKLAQKKPPGEEHVIAAYAQRKAKWEYLDSLFG